MYKSIWLSLVLTSVVFAADGPPRCTNTPNREEGICIPVKSCPPILNVLRSEGINARSFVKQFHCGFQGETPLVCCVFSNIQQQTETLDLASRIGEDDKHVKPVENEYIQPLEHELLPDRTLCGLQLVRRTIGYELDKNITNIEEFPWMAALYYTKQNGNGGEFKCGGTIISKRYVLTAARCLNISGFDLTAVRLGEWKFSANKDCIRDTELFEEVCSEPVVDVKIAEKIPHVFYNSTIGSNDIALLRLESKIQFSDFVRPICLPPRDLPFLSPGSLIIAAGWGLTETGTRANFKLKLQLKVSPSEECSETSESTSSDPCIGNSENKPFCNGESGGPLLRKFEIRDEDDIEQWYQEGIINEGLGCKSRSGVYTRTSKYIHWIVNNLKP